MCLLKRPRPSHWLLNIRTHDSHYRWTKKWGAGQGGQLSIGGPPARPGYRRTSVDRARLGPARSGHHVEGSSIGMSSRACSTLASTTRTGGRRVMPRVRRIPWPTSPGWRCSSLDRDGLIRTPQEEVADLQPLILEKSERAGRWSWWRRMILRRSISLAGPRRQ